MGFCDKPHGANKPMKLYRIKNTEKNQMVFLTQFLMLTIITQIIAIGVFSPHEILTLSDVKESA